MAIKTINITPSFYSKESRDYQLIARLYDAVFNYSKMSIDGMTNLPISINSDKRFLDLVAKTLGFESKHNYNTENLYALCSSFKKIMFHKGTILAIEESVSMLLRAQNINKKFVVKQSEDKIIQIYVPTELKDVVLIEDMMSYILPAGFTYEIYARDIKQDSTYDLFAFETEITYKTGTSPQFSRIDSYINATTVTSTTDTSSKSGKDFIDEQTAM